MSEPCIGPNTCPECGGDYGDHATNCAHNPSNKPFEPTMNLRYRLGRVEQEFVRPDGQRKWSALPTELTAILQASSEPKEKEKFEL